MKFFSKSVFAILALSAALLLQSCGDSSNPYTISYDPPPAYDTTQAVSDKTYDNDLQVYTLAEGSGEFQVVSNDVILVRYTGRRKSDGKVFTSSYIEGSSSNTASVSNLTPSASSSSAGSIKGFRLGVLGMKEGEKRTIVVPPSLGRSSFNRHTLSGKTLIFDVELVTIY